MEFFNVNVFVLGAHSCNILNCGKKPWNGYPVGKICKSVCRSAFLLIRHSNYSVILSKNTLLQTAFSVILLSIYFSFFSIIISTESN